MVLLRQSRDASVGLRGGTGEADERVEEKVGGKEELGCLHLSNKDTSSTGDDHIALYNTPR